MFSEKWLKLRYYRNLIGRIGFAASRRGAIARKMVGNAYLVRNETIWSVDDQRWSAQSQLLARHDASERFTAFGASFAY